MRVIDRTGVPTFNPSHQAAFNQMVKRAGFKTQKQFSERIGFAAWAFHNMFRNRISGELFHPLRNAVLSASGIDLSAPDLFIRTRAAATTEARHPLDELCRAGLISADELESGEGLEEAAGARAYPGKEPLPTLVRSWPQHLQLVWAGLAEADREADRCRPRLPTPSATAWAVCVGRERIEPDAITSLRIALQHI